MQPHDLLVHGCWTHHHSVGMLGSQGQHVCNLKPFDYRLLHCVKQACNRLVEYLLAGFGHIAIQLLNQSAGQHIWSKCDAIFMYFSSLVTCRLPYVFIPQKSKLSYKWSNPFMLKGSKLLTTFLSPIIFVMYTDDYTDDLPALGQILNNVPKEQLVKVKSDFNYTHEWPPNLNSTGSTSRATPAWQFKCTNANPPAWEVNAWYSIVDHYQQLQKLQMPWQEGRRSTASGPWHRNHDVGKEIWCYGAALDLSGRFWPASSSWCSVRCCWPCWIPKSTGDPSSLYWWFVLVHSHSSAWIYAKSQSFCYSCKCHTQCWLNLLNVFFPSFETRSLMAALLICTGFGRMLRLSWKVSWRRLSWTAKHAKTIRCLTRCSNLIQRRPSILTSPRSSIQIWKRWTQKYFSILFFPL